MNWSVWRVKTEINAKGFFYRNHELNGLYSGKGERLMTNGFRDMRLWPDIQTLHRNNFVSITHYVSLRPICCAISIPSVATILNVSEESMEMSREAWPDQAFAPPCCKFFPKRSWNSRITIVAGTESPLWMKNIRTLQPEIQLQTATITGMWSDSRVIRSRRSYAWFWKICRRKRKRWSPALWWTLPGRNSEL